MKSQVLHTVWCNISGGAGGEIWHWSLSGVKGLNGLLFAFKFISPLRNVSRLCDMSISYKHRDKYHSEPRVPQSPIHPRRPRGIRSPQLPARPTICPWVSEDETDSASPGWVKFFILIYDPANCMCLTLSLLRVIKVKFPLQPHQKYYITQ